jgi:AraC-like DNA-binding protein
MKPSLNPLEIDRLNPMAISVFESDKLKFPYHYHASEYELTLTLGGSGLRLTGDHIEVFRQTDLALIGPGIPHCWLNNFTDQKVKNEDIKVVVIHFNEHIFSREMLERKELEPIRNLLTGAKRGIVFYGKTRDEIKNQILKLKIDPDFNTWISLYFIFDRLSQSDEFNYLSSPDYPYSGKEEEREIFEEVHNYILNQFRKKIKIGEVASLIGMNESAFSHYFKKRTGKSFTDFINELRLNYAADQLTQSRRNVAEIAFESGFNNLSNFNRIFKKWKNVTPNQWRRRTESLI